MKEGLRGKKRCGELYQVVLVLALAELLLLQAEGSTSMRAVKRSSAKKCTESKKSVLLILPSSFEDFCFKSSFEDRGQLGEVRDFWSPLASSRARKQATQSHGVARSCTETTGVR